MRDPDVATPQATTPAPAGRCWRRWMQYGAVVVLWGVILALGARLALAPIHPGVRTAAECARGYAAARTHADTVSADLVSYPGQPGQPRRLGQSPGRRRPCGELRTVTVDLARP